MTAVRASTLSERQILEFERPIIDLEKKIEELKSLSSDSVDFSSEIGKLEEKAKTLQKEIFSTLTPQQKVQLSRHPNRPYTLDYVHRLMDEFVELKGDRAFADDPAIIGGIAKFAGEEVMILGHQKGRNTKENLHRNFGMPRPEGYRKCIRLMELASRFKRPLICFIDTPGAYPGLGAEERGQMEAIAKSLEVMSQLKCPVISVVIGEGGSGGALAIGVANTVIMLEHSIYSVISPEGCASILWRDPEKVTEAATQLKLTATDLKRLGVCDIVVEEADGGAHRDPEHSARQLGYAIQEELKRFSKWTPEKLINERYKKFRAVGSFQE